MPERTQDDTLVFTMFIGSIYPLPAMHSLLVTYLKTFLKKVEKMISTSKTVCEAPVHWSKYTTAGLKWFGVEFKLLSKLNIIEPGLFLPIEKQTCPVLGYSLYSLIMF